MNCWIGVERKDDRRVVRLAGEFKLPQVTELRRACAQEEGPVELDLRDLVSADTAGIDALRHLREQGVVFVRIPGYIELKLDTASAGSL